MHISIYNHSHTHRMLTSFSYTRRLVCATSRTCPFPFPTGACSYPNLTFQVVSGCRSFRLLIMLTACSFLLDVQLLPPPNQPVQQVPVLEGPVVTCLTGYIRMPRVLLLCSALGQTWQFTKHSTTPVRLFSRPTTGFFGPRYTHR